LGQTEQLGYIHPQEKKMAQPWLDWTRIDDGGRRARGEGPAAARWWGGGVGAVAAAAAAARV
jgi:hypothetical protein